MMNTMERTDRIRNNPIFKAEMDRICRMERDRRYCGHGFGHLMDVARVGWILNLENNYGLEKEIVYAAALLHDIGKGRQYEFGMPHHLAGAEIAGQILKDSGFTKNETEQILNAIRSHRKPTDSDDPLVTILYLADKKTRLCFACDAEEDCNWSAEKKNMKLIY